MTEHFKRFHTFLLSRSCLKYAEGFTVSECAVWELNVSGIVIYEVSCLHNMETITGYEHKTSCTCTHRANKYISSSNVTAVIVLQY